MRSLPQVRPTPEQLPIVADYRPGVLLIRGAAGSGKTSTAVQRLKFVTRVWERRLRVGDINGPIRVLVLTYNRTLRGYVEDLAKSQVVGDAVELEILTFAKWSMGLLGVEAPSEATTARLALLCWSLPLDHSFVQDEADYVLGRFLPENLDRYLTIKREARGNAPRMEQPMRQRLLDEVLLPYGAWKQERGAYDWNDLAVDLARGLVADPYDIVVVDEAQDFSANQIRAITAQLADTYSVTYVLDAAQRIYPRHFRWAEAGVTIAPNNSFRLGTNYRNTAEIAAFAAPLLSNLDVTDDGTIPDFSACNRHGHKPVVVAGRFQDQLSYMIQDLEQRRNDHKQSSAILHAAGGGWFREVRRALNEADLPYAELTRQAEWPQGEETIALSTMHSAKGLEFDHIYIVGLNAAVTPHGTDPEDSGLENYRRLLAMAITRARESVMLGYKPQEASSLIDYLAPGTFDLRSPR